MNESARQRPERVAVVGAGAVGLTAATHLARAGVDVVAVDRGDPPSGRGPGASHRAAGIVYDAYAEDVDVAVAARSLSAFRRLDAAGDLDVVAAPYVLFAREGDAETVGALERSVGRMRAHDRDVAFVAPSRLSEWGLRTDDVAVAAVARDAGWVRPRSYLAAMADRLRAAGGRLRTETDVRLTGDPPTVVETDAGAERAFDAVVVAAGAHTPGLLSDAGLAVPVKSYRSQALAVEAAYAGPTWYDATTATYARPHPGGAVVGGGVRPAVTTPERWTPTPSAAFVGGARRRFTRRTGLGARPRHAWTGLCTATPDGNPLLGAVAPGVVVATGWYGHGFMRAPASGEAAARAVLDGSTASVLGEAGAAAFDPTRFDGDESFHVVFGVRAE